MPDKKGELALLVGGALLIIGTFLAFLTIEGPGGSADFSASDLDEASSYYISGGLAIVVALVRMFGNSASTGRVLAIIGIIGIGFFGVFAAIRDYTSIDDLSPDLGVEASAAIGAYVILAGAFVAFIGCLMCLKSPSTPAAAPPA